MKKLIFTIASIALTLVVLAQNPFNPTFSKGTPIPMKNIKGAQQSSNKAASQSWYYPFQIVKKSQVGGNLSNASAITISNDSVFKSIDDDGTIDYVNWLSFGQVLDPKDLDFNTVDIIPPVLTRFTNYTLDSIGFRYYYGRNVDLIDSSPVVDTLFIAYFTGNNQLRQRNTPNTSPAVRFANPNWDISRRMPSSYTLLDTFLLDGTSPDFPATRVSNNERSYSIGYTTIAPSIPVSVAANNLVGYTVTFKSGIRAVENGDTAVITYQRDSAIFPPPSNMRRANYFGTIICTDNRTTTGVRWPNPTFYNSSLFQTPFVGYASSSVIPEVLRQYIPGTLFGNTLFADVDFGGANTYPNAGFYVVGVNTSVNEFSRSVSLNGIYPNPAAINGDVFATFNVKQASTISFKIFNITGQIVKPTLSRNFAAGDYVEQLDIKGLKAGVYLVSVDVNGQTITKKLTITQ